MNCCDYDCNQGRDCPARSSYTKVYADAMDWKLKNHLGHLPTCVNKQREWVGLTDSEFSAIYDSSATIAEKMELVEAKLKEKNCL